MSLVLAVGSRGHLEAAWDLLMEVCGVGRAVAWPELQTHGLCPWMPQPGGRGVAGLWPCLWPPLTYTEERMGKGKVRAAPAFFLYQALTSVTGDSCCHPSAGAAPVRPPGTGRRPGGHGSRPLESEVKAKVAAVVLSSAGTLSCFPDWLQRRHCMVVR